MKASDARILNILLLVLSLVVLLFSTRSLYAESISLKSTKASEENNVNNLSQQWAQIEKVDCQSEDYKKYTQKLVENEILDKFHGGLSDYGTRFEISSLSINEGSKNDLGLNEGSINVSAKFRSESEMKDVLNRIKDDTNYKFFIDNFSYNYGEVSSSDGIQVELPIKVLYQ